MRTNAKKFLEKLSGPLSFSMALGAYMDRNIMSGRKKVSIGKAVEIAESLDEPAGAFVQAAINDALRDVREYYSCRGMLSFMK